MFEETGVEQVSTYSNLHFFISKDEGCVCWRKFDRSLFVKQQSAGSSDAELSSDEILGQMNSQGSQMIVGGVKRSNIPSDGALGREWRGRVWGFIDRCLVVALI